MNKGIADYLVRGGIMNQSFIAASTFLDDMTKIIEHGILVMTSFPLFQGEHLKSKWQRIK